MRFRRTAAAATVAAVLVGGGAAYAWVTAGGSGGGSADVMSHDAVTSVALTASIDGTLSPGATKTVAITGTNGNGFTVQLGAVTLSIASGVPTGCNADDFVITQPSGTPVALDGTHLLTSYTAGSIKLVENTTNTCMGAHLVLGVTTAP